MHQLDHHPFFQWWSCLYLEIYHVLFPNTSLQSTICFTKSVLLQAACCFVIHLCVSLIPLVVLFCPFLLFLAFVLYPCFILNSYSLVFKCFFCFYALYRKHTKDVSQMFISSFLVEGCRFLMFLWNRLFSSFTLLLVVYKNKLFLIHVFLQ